MKKVVISLIFLLILMIIPTIIFGTELVDEEYVAEVVGGLKYATLSEAIESVAQDENEVIIKILKNVDDATGFVISKGQNIVIDFGGFYYDASNPLVGSKGTETLGCQFLKGSTVTLKNGKLISKKAKMLIQNYSDLTLQDMIIEPTAAQYALSCNSGTVKIVGNTSIKAIEGGIAFDMCWAPQWYPEGTQIIVNTTGTITGKIELGIWGTVDTSKAVKSTLTIENVIHDGIIDIKEKYLKEQLTIKGGVFTDIGEAVYAVPTTGEETTLKLFKNVDSGKGIVTKDGQKVIIDFAGFTYDASNPLVGSKGTETLGCQLNKGSKVTFKNGELISKKAKMLVQNYSDLTLDNMLIDGTKSEVMAYVVSNNCGKVEIINGTSIKANEGCIAMDMCWAPQWYPEGTQIRVNTTGEIIGDIELGTWGKVDESKSVNSSILIENVKHRGDIKLTKEFLKGQCVVTGGIFTSDVKEYVADGYVCENIGDIFKVGVKYTVKISTENGKVVTDKTSDFGGETVNITAIPNEGYKLEAVTVKDREGKTIEVNNNSFIMPNAEVTVFAVFAKVTQKVEAPKEVEINKEVEEILINSLKELAKNNEELAEFIENNDVEIKVKLTEKEVETEEKEAIEVEAKKELEGIKIAKYLDITIIVKNSDTEMTIPELENEITFTVEIPEDLPKVEEGYVRNYYIIRNHNGEIEIIKNAKLSEDGKFIVFGSDKFSTYAIAYDDVKEEDIKQENAKQENVKEEDIKQENVKEEVKKENATIGPVTGDDIAVYVVSLIVSIMGMIVLRKLNFSKK